MVQVFLPYVLLYIVLNLFQGSCYRAHFAPAGLACICGGGLRSTSFAGGAGGGSVGFLSNLRSYLWIPVRSACLSIANRCSQSRTR